ncbi:translation initiation factor eIF-3 subunit 8 [Phakopsora pachyrhizi]|uniref:Eukaryotic translation initiation factor 3 subunit C n=1 Tax=Phakopsora pachyrhizi TaxID=170000 RepID=A0AAV0BI63_PHAPC|nr:translation initiation factor eIF-3 subunit 8 [Phakopsora pachyrhizi]CAH7686256.1 translation initiation factor eIF-3 subunit 8 [Phakopsora pachyrhizi]
MSSFFRTVGSDSDSDSSDEELLSDGSDGSGSGLETKKPSAPLKNRFLKGGSDSDDSDSDSDSDDDMDESDSDDDQKKATAGAGAKANRFLVGAESETDSDSDDEGRRVVKSAKSKRQDEIDSSVKIMENGSKINDWVVISNEFDKLTRLVQRQASATEPLPIAFIKVIFSLEESQAAANENAATKKKMNATNAKAFNTMKQKLKKASREYEEILEKYKADPEAFEAEVAALDAPLPDKKTKKSKSVQIDEDDEGDDFTMVGKGGKSFNFSPDSIFKTLQSVLEARGKKNTDRSEQLMILEKLLSISTTTYQRIRVLLALVSSQLDYNTSTTTHMPNESWKAARSRMDELLILLDVETRYVVKEETMDYDDQEERAPDPSSEAKLEVRGSIGSLLDRLDDEFTKSLQNIDPHTSEYIERLKDEKELYSVIFRSQSYFERIELKEAEAKAVMRRLEHVYCKPDAVIQPLEAALPEVATQICPKQAEAAEASPYSSSELIHALCAYLYKTENSLLRTRAALCQIFNYALHDEYHRARDLMLMLHLQETVNAADVGTQIMFNRAVVQLGLSAFRLGLIKESQSTLQDIFASQRVKELLAQGVQAQRYSQLTPEQEKIEKQRQLPFHMHINLELLECAYLVSSMLLEIPHLAQAGNDPELKKRQISRTFRRMFEYTERQAFVGPPENKRDHIMQASKALQTGDWKKCVALINGIKIWSLMPRQEALKEMLTRKIQEEALRTYLFTYAAYYSTISLDYLSTTFQLSQTAVTSIVSKMIWNDELSGASLDQIEKVLVLAKQELTKLQQLTIGLIDKVNGMAETNDRYLETKLGADRDGGNRAGGGGGDRKDGEIQRGPRRGGGAKNYRGGRGGRGTFSGPIGGRAIAAGGNARGT